MTLKNDTMLSGGKYRIMRFISAGGFGCTYEAVHTLMNTRVAIKEFFPKDFCNRDENTSQVSVGTKSQVELVARLKKQFLREAKVLFDMKHPSVVRVIDFFEENGTAYYVMDYIDGPSLEQILKENGPMPEPQAVKSVSLRPLAREGAPRPETEQRDDRQLGRTRRAHRLRHLETVFHRRRGDEHDDGTDPRLRPSRAMQ